MSRRRGKQAALVLGIEPTSDPRARDACSMAQAAFGLGQRRRGRGCLPHPGSDSGHHPSPVLRGRSSTPDAVAGRDVGAFNVADRCDQGEPVAKSPADKPAVRAPDCARAPGIARRRCRAVRSRPDRAPPRLDRLAGSRWKCSIVFCSCIRGNTSGDTAPTRSRNSRKSASADTALPGSRTRCYALKAEHRRHGQPRRGEDRPWSHGDDDRVAEQVLTVHPDTRDRVPLPSRGQADLADEFGPVRFGRAHHRASEQRVNLRSRLRQTQALADGDAIGHPARGMMLAGGRDS